MGSSCVLLNGDYAFLCLVDWKKAMRLVVAEKVKVIKYSDRTIWGVDRAFKAPAVMVLIKIVRTVYRGKVPFSKKNVLIRDHYTCAYCGNKEKYLTIDHIIPRSKGGKTDFDNCVASCKACNNRKGSKTPRQAGMRLKKRPYQPTITEFMRIQLKQSRVFKLLQEIGIY